MDITEFNWTGWGPVQFRQAVRLYARQSIRKGRKHIIAPATPNVSYQRAELPVVRHKAGRAFRCRAANQDSPISEFFNFPKDFNGHGPGVPIQPQDLVAHPAFCHQIDILAFLRRQYTSHGARNHI